MNAICGQMKVGGGHLGLNEDSKCLFVGQMEAVWELL